MGITVKLDLVTDREARHVYRVDALRRAGWEAMTAAERLEWWHGLSDEYVYWREGTPVTCLDGVIVFIATGDINKGAYNYKDWNRVEGTAEYLAGILRGLPELLREHAREHGVAWDTALDVPYDPEDFRLTVKTDWAMEDIPTPGQLDRYLENVRRLRGALEYETEELPATMAVLTYAGANAIERALLGLGFAIEDFHTWRDVENIEKSCVYSDDVFSREV